MHKDCTDLNAGHQSSLERYNQTVEKMDRDYKLNLSLIKDEVLPKRVALTADRTHRRARSTIENVRVPSVAIEKESEIKSLRQKELQFKTEKL